MTEKTKRREVAAKRAATKKTAANVKRQQQKKSANRDLGVAVPIVDETKEASRLVQANLMALGGVLFLTIANLVLVWSLVSSKTEVIATTESGSIINPVPLPQAFVTDSRVLGFVDECVRASFAHDFENYRRTVNSVLPCYTSQGGKSFSRALEPLLEDIRSRRLVMSATMEPPAIVRGPYILGGRATWELETILTLHFQGTRERFPVIRRRASVMVVRVPLEENYRGVAIEAIQLSPY